MQQLLLLRGGVECARYASPEFEILEDPRLRMEFPRVIAESRQMARIEPFLELMAESLARAVERVAAEAQAQATPSVAPTRSRSSEPNVEAVEPEVEARPEDADFSLD